jgi:hypothetical protein
VTAPRNTTLGGNLSAARLLVFGGISLILAGMMLGEIFAIFVSHVGSAQIRWELSANVIPAIASHDLDKVDEGYRRIENLMERRGRIMDAHSHMIAYGFLALVLALFQAASQSDEPMKRIWALCIVGGGLVQSLSVFVSYWITSPFRSWSLAASAAGGTLVLFGVLGNYAALRGGSAWPDFAGLTAQRLASASSGILLKAGAFLILAGMVFGFYYAWVYVTQHEPGQMLLLQRAFESAGTRDIGTASASALAYRGLQSRIAIVTAAHSHVIEMGIMAILLAFVQDFVFLGERWKRRWAILFVIGAAIMPVCTYLASMYGLLFAGFADTFGLMSVVALFAMLCGIVRHTGSLERRPA